MYKIYLIYAETEGIGQWKIGITTNIEERLANLRVGNPNICGVKTLYEIEDRSIAYKVEALLKRHCKPFKINGEWLRFDAFDKNTFHMLCTRLEENAKVWKEYQNNMKFNKNITR